jgi:anion-transporting  ArsA/GET3 family ATPase
MEDDKDTNQEVTPPESEKQVTGTRGRKSTLGIPYRSGTREYARAYYEKNREKMNARMVAYQRAHPDKARASTAKWNRANPDKLKEGQKSYREVVKEELSVLKGDSSTSKPRFEDMFDEEKKDD